MQGGGWWVEDGGGCFHFKYAALCREPFLQCWKVWREGWKSGGWEGGKWRVKGCSEDGGTWRRGFRKSTLRIFFWVFKDLGRPSRTCWRQSDMYVCMFQYHLLFE